MAPRPAPPPPTVPTSKICLAPNAWGRGSTWCQKRRRDMRQAQGVDGTLQHKLLIPDPPGLAGSPHMLLALFVHHLLFQPSRPIKQAAMLNRMVYSTNHHRVTWPRHFCIAQDLPRPAASSSALLPLPPSLRPSPRTFVEADLLAHAPLTPSSAAPRLFSPSLGTAPPLPPFRPHSRLRGRAIRVPDM